MQKQRYFDGRTSQDIFETMRLMLNAEFCSYFGAIREDDYEWVIGADVWDRIIKNDSNSRNNIYNIESIITNCGDIIYKIFYIEVTISTKELNTITLRKRKKDERRNEMPVEKKSTIRYNGYTSVSTSESSISVPAIKKVIFNYPATIVIWQDGSKTVVKCQDGDIYDPEKGLAMAISKKALGNKGNYCNEFKKWLPEDEEEEEKTVELRFDTSEISKSLEGLASRIFSNKEK
mgnify:CR=1 FL=1